VATNPVPARFPSSRIRVLVADDHDLFAETLVALLAGDDRIEIVGRAADGAEAVRLACTHRPDVVLMDVHMPRMDGIDATLALRVESPAVRVVMLSSSSAVEDVRRSALAGAVGYLTKDADAARIKAEVMRAASVICPLTGIRAA
jgi:DNA-binding NarL/FixJ family response regulator